MKTIIWVNYTWRESRGPSKKFVEYLIQISKSDPHNQYIAVFPPCSDEAPMRVALRDANIHCEFCPITWFTELVDRDVEIRRKAYQQLQSNTKKLISIIKKYQCQLVIGNTSLSWESILAAHRCRVPHITFFRGILNPYDFDGHRQVNFKILRHLEKELLRLTDHKVTQSDFTARLWNIYGEEDHTTIPLGTSEVATYTVPELKDGLKVITMCTIEPNKNLELIVKVARRVKDLGGNIVFHIYGNKTDRIYADRIQKLIIEKDLTNEVKMYPYASQVGEILGQYHVVLISSLLESFGATSIEGMASRRLIVTTNCGGPEEIIADGDCGYVRDKEEPMSIAELLIELIHDHEKVKAMGERGYNKWKQEFHLPVVIQQWKNLIHRLLETEKKIVDEDKIRDLMQVDNENFNVDYQEQKWLVIVRNESFPSVQLLKRMLNGVCRHFKVTIDYHTIELAPKELTAYNRIIFVRILEKAGLDLLKDAKVAGIPAYYYTDDCLFDLPAYAKEQVNNMEVLDQFMVEVNGIITCSSWLKQAYKDRYPKVKDTWLHTLYEMPETITPMVKTKDQFVIGYAGNVDHRYGLEDLKQPLQQLYKAYKDKVRFEFIGAKPSYLEDIEGVYFPPMPFEEYETLMYRRKWDIGIAYLRDTPFNNNKYFNKYMEYSRFGICGIYSDIALYRRVINMGSNGICVQNKQENWLNYLRYMINHPDLVKQMGQRAYEDFICRNNHEELSADNARRLQKLYDLTES